MTPEEVELLVPGDILICPLHGDPHEFRSVNDGYVHFQRHSSAAIDSTWTQMVRIINRVHVAVRKVVFQ